MIGFFRTAPSFSIVALTFSALLLVGACSAPPANEPFEEASGAGGKADGSLPCDVDEVLESKCRDCHAAEPRFGAPHPLVSKADLLATTLDGGSRVIERSIERMRDETSIMPPPPNMPATEAEIAVLEKWVADGHPVREANDTCGGSGGSDGSGGSASSCTPDLVVKGQAPFEMPKTSTDKQICLGVTVPAGTEKRHITRIAPLIDNSKIIHHILLLQSPSPVSPEPVNCNLADPNWKLLYAWGPGTPPLELPEEAGFPLEENEPTHFVLQIHYNNLNQLEGEQDQSGLELCTTSELRTHDADVLAFGGIGFSGIAPNATSSMSCSTTLTPAVEKFLPVTIFQSWPHMHQLGSSFSSTVTHADQSTSVLADVPNYSFDYQITYPNDVQLKPGDTIQTSCTWKNTTPNAASFGEDTADEMCFNFVSYYPRIETTGWFWLLPAATASCSAVEVQ